MTAGFRTTRAYQTLPSLPSRGILPPQIGVIIPLARTNMITNPSIELATTNYTAVGGSIARSATQQYHGTYSLAVTPGAGTTDGAYYGTIALTSGTIYAFSCKFRGIAGIPYKISIATTGGVDLSVYTFFGTGRWQWVYGYYVETSSTNRRFYFTKNGSTNTSVFYVDGVQVETINAGEVVSTYIDGDQLGLLVNQQPPAYLWTGTPHASTSTRSALTRAGGYVLNLQDAYNFILTGAIGLGMAVPNNVSVPYTVLDGARYLRTTKPPRTISLPGRFQDDDIFSLRQHQSDMRAAFDRDLIPIQQPMVLQVQPQDECGNVIGDFANIQCIYSGGLDGDDSNFPAEDAAPTFTMYVPFILGGDAGTALTVQLSVGNANDILTRSPTGVWSAMGTGGDFQVYAIAIGLDGKVYAGGVFTSMGGVANTAGIAYWDGSAWNAMGTGSVGTVRVLAVAPNGDIVAAGAFTSMGGVANTARIARWNGSAWSALSTGITTAASTAYDMAIASNGDIYVTGDFTAPATRIARWNGSAWSGLGTGLNAQGVSLAFNPAGQLYVGGDFTTANGVAAVRIARWDGTTFVALAAGLNNTVQTLAVGTNGILYAGGIFTNTDYPYIAQWNGTAWTAVGGGLNDAVYAIRPTSDGRVYAGGIFTASNTITFPDSLAVWNGSTWLPADVDLPSTPIVYEIAQAKNGTLYIGYNSAGSAIAAATTTVSNGAPGYVFPRIVINGPSSGTSRIYQVVNYTTGFGVWLDLTLNAGEVATLDFDPQNPSYTTTFQGDITNKILPGSTPSLMYLAPGANSISFFAASSTVTATESRKNRYNGVADLVN